MTRKRAKKLKCIVAFPSILNEQMKAKGITQQALSDEIGVTRQTVSNYLAGVSLPDIETTVSLSKYFKVSVDYLLTGLDRNTSLLPDFINIEEIPLADDIVRYITRPTADGFVSLDDNGIPEIAEHRTEYSHSLEEYSKTLTMQEIARDLELLRERYWKPKLC